MEGTPAIYLGRIVSKENFRAFIYGPNGLEKLVESWAEYEASMQSGIWFSTREDAEKSVAVKEDEKPKAKPRPSRAKKVEPEPLKEDEDALIEEELIDSPPEDAAFEVTDDFLPRA